VLADLVPTHETIENNTATGNTSAITRITKKLLLIFNVF
jgi:hypothetical protein